MSHTGETGCGKSTGVPQALLEDLLASNSTLNVLITQPRRLAAVAIAEHVAEERGGACGGEVGYSIGGGHMASGSTRVLFVTAGVLLERLRQQGEAALRHFKYVIVDEVHERSSENGG